MDMIIEIAQISGLVLTVTTAISILYGYYRKAKKENEQRYVEDAEHFYRMASKFGISIDEACDACKTLQNKDLNEINSYTKTKWNKMERTVINFSLSTQYGKDYLIEYLETTYPDFSFYFEYDALHETFSIKIKSKTGMDNSKVFKYDLCRFDKPNVITVIDDIRDWMDETIGTIKSGDGLFICDTGTISPCEPVVIKPHHCECCGAPMPKGTTKCEYCGTEYY